MKLDICCTHALMSLGMSTSCTRGLFTLSLPWHPFRTSVRHGRKTTRPLALECYKPYAYTSRGMRCLDYVSRLPKCLSRGAQHDSTAVTAGRACYIHHLSPTIGLLSLSAAFPSKNNALRSNVSSESPSRGWLLELTWMPTIYMYGRLIH